MHGIPSTGKVASKYGGETSTDPSWSMSHHVVLFFCLVKIITNFTTAGLDARNNRVKNSFPTNWNSYGHSKTTVGKLLKRRIQWLWVFFILIFCAVMLCNIFNDGPAKHDPQTGDASRRDLSYGGLRSFVTIPVCWEVIVYAYFGRG